MSNEAPAGPTDPTPPVTAAPAKKTGAARYVTPILALVAALVIGIFGGVIIGHSTASASTQAGAGAGFGQGRLGAEGGFGGQGGATGAPGGAGGNFTSGTIVSVSGNTVVIKQTDGTKVTVTTSGSTAVTKTTKSSVSALATGDTITVIGAKDSSGNVTATTIADGQTGFGGRPGGGGGQQGGGNG
ncbi:MAG: hypothetical protein JWR36_2928 [Glaciihabitans sp.]|jgi:hypothetical protein|nr:hypothetical protein [Glaciihabitans sp.]MDQ1571626.1 hypothetical protein [Actinomycetota bacterium]